MKEKYKTFIEDHNILTLMFAVQLNLSSWNANL